MAYRAILLRTFIHRSSKGAAMSNKVIIVGAGHMGSAIIRGLIQAGSAGLQVIDPIEDRLAPWRARGLACSHTLVDAACGDTLVLAMPPQAFPAFALACPDLSGRGGIVVSVMAGVRIATIASVLHTQKVVRVIPNTPSEVLEGMSVCCRSQAVDADESAYVLELLKAFGDVVDVADEALLDPATALCGGGPAFVAYFADAMQDFALVSGFGADDARRMTLQVLRGTAALIAASGKPPSRICSEVMTPGGTTERGIACFDRFGVRHAVREALARASARSSELGAVAPFQASEAASC
jgi:pyrroline-5-carboxylate reductase